MHTIGVGSNFTLRGLKLQAQQPYIGKSKLARGV